MKMKNRKITAIDLVLVVVTLFALGGGIYYYNLESVQFSPADKTILFEFLYSGEIFIDDERFVLIDGLVVELEKGEHYFKVERGDGNELWKLEIEDEAISLKFLDIGERFAVVNAESVNLNVVSSFADKVEEKFVLGGAG